MGVYINTEMPTTEQGVRTINIYADGVVTNYAEEAIGKAVPVPPHGRLIDADALCKMLRRFAENEYTPDVFANWIENHIDTIIEAEEDE